MTINEVRAEIKVLEIKIYKTSDWQAKGKLIQEAFKLSAEIVKTVVPAEKHGIIDQVVETLLTKRGAGWFCDKHQELVITTTDRQAIAKYAAEWLTKAREAGLVLS